MDNEKQETTDEEADVQQENVKVVDETVVNLDSTNTDVPIATIIVTEAIPNDHAPIIFSQNAAPKKKEGRKRQYNFADLKVGEKFAIEGGQNIKKRLTVRQSAYYYRNVYELGDDFKFKIYKEEDGLWYFKRTA